MIFNLIFSVEIHRKSILKQARPSTPTRPKAEVVLEQAIERTLNFLQPQRKFYARERILKQAYK